MTDIIEVTRSMVANYMSQFDPSHDMHHIDRVYRLALHLAEQDALKDRVDLTVIQLAALCHDIGDRKYISHQEQKENIEQFLIRHGYDETKARLVQKIVDNIGYSKELGWNKEDPDADWRDTCLELHAVQDADKLDAIGAFGNVYFFFVISGQLWGIMRCAAYSGAKDIPIHVPQLDPILHMTQKEYTNQKGGTAINHFHEKLFRLSSMMRTPTGKQLAKKRDQFMHAFIRQIEDEEKVIY
ncbi:hypothetical protein BDA99DRAFT_531504 [Phascolomyces articulosus]|uniref:HD/PDEase domain-containing protein n=1 Tax=Phascolomyces articulosus TaxID=60185 RepID=A0AAD5KSF3_9FUNG|nr:hypothetical protein BDA99DRAFT_531504 [Phascolomyces articulosus]